MLTEKENLIQALSQFIKQRPGLEFGNYGDVGAYRAELRSITKSRHHAEALLSQIGWRESITADDIIRASQHAYSGRLTITRTDTGGFRIDYCTGQYFPTEYRNAVCAVLSSVLWDYWRSDTTSGDGAGDRIRNTARKVLGRSIAQTWFR